MVFVGVWEVVGWWGLVWVHFYCIEGLLFECLVVTFKLEFASIE